MKTSTNLYNFCKKHSEIAHYVLSLTISMSFYLFNCILSFQLSLIASFIFSSIFFIGKEIYDFKSTGFDFIDLIRDYIGFSVGCIFILIFNH